MLPPAGSYTARLAGQIIVYVTESGALCAALPVSMGCDEWTWSGKHTMTLFKQDGTANINTLDTLKEVFGWDGIDPFWLMWEDFEQEAPQIARDLSEIDFNIVGEHEEYTPQDGAARTVFKIKWLNPMNRSARMPKAADRRSVLAKFGGQLRALAGSPPPKVTPAPAQKAAPAEQKELPTQEPAPAKKKNGKAAPSAPPARTSTPAGVAPTATMEEAWDSLVKSRPGDSEETLGEIWYAAIEQVAPGKQAPDLSIQQWGQLKQQFEKK